ncbi:MAG: hypothetical protein ABFS17_04150 [Chloroflexota bacterium]
MVYYKKIVLLIIVLFLTSCLNNNIEIGEISILNVEPKPELPITGEVSIFLPEMGRQYEINKEPITIFIENKSDNRIRFSSDYCTEVFRMIEKDGVMEYEKIEAIIPNIGPDYFYYDPAGEGSYQGLFQFAVKLPRNEGPINLRLFIRGRIIDEEMKLGDELGAYLDFTVVP